MDRPGEATAAQPEQSDVETELGGDGWIPAVATIHLPGLRCGQTAMVDPRDEATAACLRARYLIPILD